MTRTRDDVRSAIARQRGLAEARNLADDERAWVHGRPRWLPAGDVGESGSPFAQRAQASCGVGKLGSLLGVSGWGCCPPLGNDIGGPARDIGPHDLPLSDWALAHHIRVLMIVSLQPLSFRFGPFTLHRRSISRLGGLLPFPRHARLSDEVALIPFREYCLTLASGRLPLLWGGCARAHELAATRGLFSP